ncbi:unnamed protein product [Vitrella brassicaformis CCMP3155]|uniref:Uncharacterized protein n=2 Tax=Vitrella brassicaformis TaxID=1169539 RepID=A0A0G4GKG2_VITBC|nr:unnamed protein product [Vitrella brassicaformis CCMP3155]|mmetsp:Transcript_36138/g.90155  ORF Transcript_36138/g.90155 Transcript_36138/m.90155 type:complete len:246 (+) Transcript_36138:130-867(+)|eukprot:CEM30522.1 unnamed protein product [Vitrella brassicaformis CCMP3155]
MMVRVGLLLLLACGLAQCQLRKLQPADNGGEMIEMPIEQAQDLIKQAKIGSLMRGEEFASNGVRVSMYDNRLWTSTYDSPDEIQAGGRWDEGIARPVKRDRNNTVVLEEQERCDKIHNKRYRRRRVDSYTDIKDDNGNDEWTVKQGEWKTWNVRSRLSDATLEICKADGTSCKTSSDWTIVPAYRTNTWIKVTNSGAADAKYKVRVRCDNLLFRCSFRVKGYHNDNDGSKCIKVDEIDGPVNDMA